jgi:hypothetical protein
MQRVALAAAMPEGFLLHSSADLIDGLGAELRDMKCVQYRGGVFELVVDGVFVSVKRVQRGHLHLVTEGLAASFEPVPVDRAGTTRDAGPATVSL